DVVLGFHVLGLIIGQVAQLYDHLHGGLGAGQLGQDRRDFGILAHHALPWAVRPGRGAALGVLAHAGRGGVLFCLPYRGAWGQGEQHHYHHRGGDHCPMLSLQAHQAVFLGRFFTLSTKTSAGLKNGMSWAGMMMVVLFLRMRPVFCARCFTRKLPKPRKCTSSPASRLFFTSSMNASSVARTTPRSMPV